LILTQALYDIAKSHTVNTNSEQQVSIYNSSDNKSLEVYQTASFQEILSNYNPDQVLAERVNFLFNISEIMKRALHKARNAIMQKQIIPSPAYKEVCQKLTQLYTDLLASMKVDKKLCLENNFQGDIRSFYSLILEYAVALATTAAQKEQLLNLRQENKKEIETEDLIPRISTMMPLRSPDKSLSNSDDNLTKSLQAKREGIKSLYLEAKILIEYLKESEIYHQNDQENLDRISLYLINLELRINGRFSPRLNRQHRKSLTKILSRSRQGSSSSLEYKNN